MIASETGVFGREAKDILIADIALSIGFSLALTGGIFYVSGGGFLYLLPIAFVAVSLAFILHELMHKFVAQRFGAIAGFRKSDNGIVISLLTSAFGFIIGLPGATVIYAPHFTRKEEGYVSLAGPLTNFVVFAFAFMLGSALFPGFAHTTSSVLFGGGSTAPVPYLELALSFVAFISIYLAFFNMLPIFPLDGSKVYRWNKPVFFATIIIIFALLGVITPILALLPWLALIFIIAFVISRVYKAVLF